MTPERLTEIEERHSRSVTCGFTSDVSELVAALLEAQNTLERVRALADKWDDEATFGWLRFSGPIRAVLDAGDEFQNPKD